MVVDDENLVRVSLRRALLKHGHVVETAEDGHQALGVWESFRPRLVFLDVLMPRLSGPDLLKTVPETLRREAKVILMSAFSGEYDLEKAKSLGADLYLPKPFEDVFQIVKQGEELADG
jgi:CheY-like chemotaxis protein